LDGSLEMMGYYELPEETRRYLLAHARNGGALNTEADEFPHRVAQMLQLIVSTPEYQFA
jgi:hypothetical protein